MRIITLIVSILFFQLVQVQAQIQYELQRINADSLHSVLPELKGSEKIDALNRIAFKLCNKNPDSTVSLAKRAIEYSDALDYIHGRAYGYFNLGNGYFFKDSLRNSVINYLTALRIFEIADTCIEMCYTLNVLSALNWRAGRLDQAIKYTLKETTISLHLQAHRNEISTLVTLGMYYIENKSGDSANHYLDKALNLLVSYPDTNLLASAYLQKGRIALRRYTDQSLGKENLQESLNWNLKILELDELFDFGKHGSSGLLLLAYSNLSTSYFWLGEEKDIKAGYEYIDLAKYIAETLDHQNWSILYTYYLLARLERASENHESAIELYKEGIRKAEVARSRFSIEEYEGGNPFSRVIAENYFYKERLNWTYAYMYDSYLELGDPENALKYYILKEETEKEIFMEDNKNLIAMLEADSEIEKTNSQITLLEKENEVKDLTIRQSRTYLYVLGGSILVLLLIALLFFRQRKIRTALREQKLEHDLEIKKVESDKLKELDRLKSRFLLTISKLESGKMQLNAQEKDAIPFIKGYVQSFESLAKQKKIDLVFKSKRDDILFWIDQEKFEQVLNNLLSNAFKFTSGGGRIDIGVYRSIGSQVLRITGTGRPQEVNNYIEISITDTGPGIPPEHLPHIFDRFYQVGQENNSYFEGTGIGLALTKELVELHYGRIEVESEVGAGTTFRIYLPVGREHLSQEEIDTSRQSTVDSRQLDAELETSSATPHPLNPQPPFPPLLEERGPGGEVQQTTMPIILIVEDNPDMRAYIREYFETDYHIIEAIEGMDGFEKSIENIPDIIISDVMMPKMDGNEFCRKVKTDERTCHIPVILLTARASTEYKIEGLETGADDYISKPFDPKELQVRVRNLIEQRQNLRKKFVADFWEGDRSPVITIPASELNNMDRKFLQKALDIVNRHLAEPDFNINQFSDKMAMSRQQIHRKMRALVNQSATEFIRVIRLKKAAQLLATKSGTVSEIAYDVGFSSLSYFTTSFKHLFGMSPSDYMDMKS